MHLNDRPLPFYLDLSVLSAGYIVSNQSLPSDSIAKYDARPSLEAIMVETLDINLWLSIILYGHYK